MSAPELSPHVFKLCSAFFESSDTISVVLSRIQKRTSHNHGFDQFALAYELQVATREILSAESAHPLTVSTEALMRFENEDNEAQRLLLIPTLLPRLPARDRLVLLLSDGMEIDRSTVAMALRTSEASLDLLLRDAHSTLLEWVWPSHTHSDLKKIQASIRTFVEDPTRQVAIEVPTSQRSTNRRERWRRLPWGVRTAVEAAGIGLIVFVLTLAVPRIQTLVERRLQNKLDQFNMAEVPPGPPAQTTTLDTVPNTDTGAMGAALESDDEELAEDEPSTPDPSRAAKQGEIWRFLIRADVPRDARKKVQELLGAVKVDPPLTPEEIKGVEVPGGIQFNVVLPPERVLEMKVPLQGLSTKTSADPVLRPPFSWYRSRSKVPLPPGRVRVVIWISQL